MAFITVMIKVMCITLSPESLYIVQTLRMPISSVLHVSLYDGDQYHDKHSIMGYWGQQYDESHSIIEPQYNENYSIIRTTVSW